MSKLTVGIALSKLNNAKHLPDHTSIHAMSRPISGILIIGSYSDFSPAGHLRQPIRVEVNRVVLSLRRTGFAYADADKYATG